MNKTNKTHNGLVIFQIKAKTTKQSSLPYIFEGLRLRFATTTKAVKHQKHQAVKSKNQTEIAPKNKNFEVGIKLMPVIVTILGGPK